MTEYTLRQSVKSGRKSFGIINQGSLVDYILGQAWITTRGRLKDYISGQKNQSGAGITIRGKKITKWSRDYNSGQNDYKVEQGLQIRGVITNWGSFADYILGHAWITN